MFRRPIFKILLVCITAAVIHLLLRDRTPPLLARIDGDAVASLAQRLSPTVEHVYDRADVGLYNDRGYHTTALVQRLRGLHFAPMARNETRPYVIHVRTATTLYTLANRNDRRGLKGWEPLPDAVRVADAYGPRTLDVVLQRAVAPGLYVVRGPRGGPGRPLFFDAAAAGLVR